jgi:hypothetical protein
MASYIKEALSKRNTSQILRERDRLKYQAFISITQSKVNYNTLTMNLVGIVNHGKEMIREKDEEVRKSIDAEL